MHANTAPIKLRTKLKPWFQCLLMDFRHQCYYKARKVTNLNNFVTNIAVGKQFLILTLQRLMNQGTI